MACIFLQKQVPITAGPTFEFDTSRVLTLYERSPLESTGSALVGQHRPADTENALDLIITQIVNWISIKLLAHGYEAFKAPRKETQLVVLGKTITRLLLLY